MGNSPSNRKITVTNDEVAGVIKISDSVVRRLKGEIEQERKKESATQKQKSEEPDTQSVAPDTSVPIEPPAIPSEKPTTPASATAPTSSASETTTNNYDNLMEEAHLTALKIRQEKEAEIRRIQEHWRNQLQHLTDHYNKLAELTEAEYRTAIEDVERSFVKESFHDVCKEQKERVLKCYLEHKGQPLYCADEVKEFASAVQKFRVNSLDKPEH